MIVTRYRIQQKANREESAFVRFPINMRLHLTLTILNLSMLAHVSIADEIGIVIVDVTRPRNPYLKHEFRSNRLFSPKYHSRLSMHILRKEMS